MILFQNLCIWSTFSFTFLFLFFPFFLQIHELHEKENTLVIRQKRESQNRGDKKTKHAKFYEKRTFLSPYIPGGKRYSFSGKFACFVFSWPPFGDLPFCLITDEQQFLWREAVEIKYILHWYGQLPTTMCLKNFKKLKLITKTNWNKKCLHCSKNPHEMGLKVFNEQVKSFWSEFAGVMADVFRIRETTVVTFKETVGWLLPK